ncbi:4-(cytidine 5'-diphospho)-2-C-methyl-D-erythritol kinase [Campylobacter sp. VicNov18]|uniref:4-(cytidine 5'-diphospho)-2-C-methyl-D-erythritol kinase n=1 Tax=Campylobacter bilis TaxID=2691918 RepID=UPI00130DCDA2|nr:4-(cytidine 5'-diphospho)-2-C-methyl-D-erythritol kinase [Campylobacter bilis]MPV63653.1 4-(cytidine 5'-diphospho)-2-C-methyl-D-erythritol kinase [Campylobacter hepaticus]MBM0637154.1 4-(cytidine 5'-diphospho)-2-C-methyl-D-erythritol kinase [Campylobacter bilis]MCC8277870.1 4-(cytidine 5'-diphospho)-2-C-methyl-D-erythritol kinase [Campylobacter bilis]MCC8298801.1 4-(cytidine 5'-diphospho)-2-C-methyl-D-erythritol kinase [Campylobacter bilis]MCC8300780.1 4-(cytidine 5'-diphospho)-2-C-methyl-D
MKAYAKANIFLKLTGWDLRKYHLLQSRFILLKDLFDELELVDKQPHSKQGFEIISDFQCQNNILEKAYLLLCKTHHKELKELFSTKSLKLTKNIPVCAGLGGGSSDCASFLKLINETLNLKLSTQTLINLSMQLGSDIAFFLSGFDSANVSGCGELISEFEDDIPDLKWIFPQIACQTKAVYDEFDKQTFNLEKNKNQAEIYKKLSTKELLQNFKNKELNDLFTPCATLYPKMKPYFQEGFFLSGSGSSVFKVCS